MCEFLCDFSKQWISQVQDDNNQLGETRQRTVWPTLAASRVAENCPAVAAKASSDFSPSSLLVPAGMNLVIYGHSYTKQIFQTIVTANEKLVTSTWNVEFRGGVNDSLCAGASGGELAAPLCGDHSQTGDLDGPKNCHSVFHSVYHLANGATVTGVFNYPALQNRKYALKNLTEFLRAGTGTPYGDNVPRYTGNPSGPFTHALVMEPHSAAFFGAPGGVGARVWNEESCTVPCDQTSD